MSELSELLARVEAASRPSHALDRDLLTHFGFRALDINEVIWERGDVRLGMGLSNLTGSVDAALALCERVLPGWSVQFGVYPKNIGNHARVGGDHLVAEPVGLFHGNKPPAIVLCAAILRALSALTPPPHREGKQHD